MKKFLASVVLLTTLILAACEKEKPCQEEPRGIIGSWANLRSVEEIYRPIDTLRKVNEYVGVPFDSLQFKPNNQVTIFEGPDQFEEEYRLFDDDSIRIAKDMYRITKMTDTEFNLLREKTNLAKNQRVVWKIFLTRF